MKREPTPEGRALPIAIARRAGPGHGRTLLFLGGTAGRAGRGLVAGVALALGAPVVLAQAPRAPGAAASGAAVREDGIRWQALTAAQRDALAPLEREWPGIDTQRKQKWIALAARFGTLSPEERARIHARMVEWAKLTPAERGQARLRFEEARQLPVPERSERWRAYQALPPEQREKLAARAATAASAPRDAASKPAKAGRDSKEAKFNVVPNPALAQPPKPVAPTLVQAAPGATTTVITRRPAPPPHQQSGMPKIATTPEFVNRSTLLPRRGPQAAAIASAPAAAMPSGRPGQTQPGPLAAASRPVPGQAAFLAASSAPAPGTASTPTPTAPTAPTAATTHAAPATPAAPTMPAAPTTPPAPASLAQPSAASTPSR